MVPIAAGTKVVIESELGGNGTKTASTGLYELRIVVWIIKINSFNRV
jgi:hypothetical protein